MAWSRPELTSAVPRLRRPGLWYAASTLTFVAAVLCVFSGQFFIAILLGMSVVLLAVSGLVLGLRRASIVIDHATTVLDAPGTVLSRRERDEPVTTSR